MKIRFDFDRKTKSNLFRFVIEECLTTSEAAKVSRLNLSELKQLSTGERIALFSSLIGQKATWFNTKFEHEIILKSQKDGLLNWATKAEMKEKYRREIIRIITGITEVLTSEQEENLFAELAEIKIGIRLTEEETCTITELCSRVDNTRMEMENGGSLEAFEYAKGELDSYIEQLKQS